MSAVIFSGNSNKKLATDIANLVGIPLSPVEIIRFADSECRVRINEEVEGKDVFIIQSLSNPVDEHLIELLLMGDAAKRGEPTRPIMAKPRMRLAAKD